MIKFTQVSTASLASSSALTRLGHTIGRRAVSALTLARKALTFANPKNTKRINNPALWPSRTWQSLAIMA